MVICPIDITHEQSFMLITTNLNAFQMRISIPSVNFQMKNEGNHMQALLNFIYETDDVVLKIFQSKHHIKVKIDPCNML
jgi:hypothetical protein